MSLFAGLENIDGGMGESSNIVDLLDEQADEMTQMQEEDQLNVSLELLANAKKVISEYGYNDSLQLLFGDSFNNMNISGSDHEIIESIEQILSEHGYIESSNERIADWIDNNRILGVIGLVVLNTLTAGSASIITSMSYLLSIDKDIREYQDIYKNITDKKTLEPHLNIISRNLSKVDLIERLSAMGDTIDIINKMNNGAKIDKATLVELAKRNGIERGIFVLSEKEKSDYKNIRRITLSDGGYSVRDFETISKLWFRNIDGISKLKAAAKNIKTTGKQNKDNLTGQERQAIKFVSKLVRASLVYSKETSRLTRRVLRTILGRTTLQS